MSHKNITKNGRRFVLYISDELREEIKGWVKKEGTSLADFTRDALLHYLRQKRHEERKAELEKTCQLLADWNERSNNGWPTSGMEGFSK